MPSVAVGIDLGTTNSCAAVYLSEKVQFIQNGLGDILTPSNLVVQRNDYDEDQYQYYMHTHESISFDIKRLIGRNFSDPQVHKNIKDYPFDVIRGQNGYPLIKLSNGETFLPEQLSAKILLYLRKEAEYELGKKVSNAVITVPAYFNDAQRQATRDAEINSSPIEIARKAKQLRLLKISCERATNHLSITRFFNVKLDAFHHETNLNFRITHNTFELINKNNYDKCLDTLNRIVRTAKLTKDDIDDVILVGCSSGIPLMKTKITEHFNGKKPLETIEGDQVVAYGAAIQASKFFEIQDEQQKQYDKMAKLEAKVSELFRQRGWDFDENEVKAFHNWLECRDQ
ncbi:unnamed protein product [Allacma fusca]|uniref:Heat shock protein 70 n=1 Tax=Allacma fusca TaxID=39272 RepID=A0A8J2J5U4_9HEXA|nr:unnamed protein product [Allacma fusca]